jgi:DNA-binding MarR family transcriptional regulator
MHQRTLQMLLTLGLFFIIWLLLAAFGPALVNTQAVLKWLSENEWLQFLNSDIQDVLFIQGWQPLAALMLAALAYASLKAPAAYLKDKITPASTYELSEDAEKILKALHRPDYIRRMSGLSRDLGLDNARVTQGLDQLAKHGLVIKREKRSGTFWKSTFDGQARLKQMAAKKEQAGV